jgi:hypothetical protein
MPNSTHTALIRMEEKGLRMNAKVKCLSRLQIFCSTLLYSRNNVNIMLAMHLLALRVE